jgi:hypothetical protein
MTHAIYERTMLRLRVAIRLLAAALLALVAHSVTDGLNIADVITGTAIALLLIASVGLTISRNKGVEPGSTIGAVTGIAAAVRILCERVHCKQRVRILSISPTPTTCSSHCAKVRHGILYEIGLANRHLTAGRRRPACS